jgi:DNA helicase-2/ATP-dependent DNA helicase PcrA
MASREQLNEAQRAAVEHELGPLLVLAGAGSGKTRVITQRIARLVDRGTRPESILAVSFTNKAAEEMRERLARVAGQHVARKVWMSTFHSFGVRFLSEETKALGYGGRFVVFDGGDSLGLVREILKRERPGERKLDAAAVLARISLWKNRLLDPEQVTVGDFEYDVVAREVYPEYEASLRAMRAVDFDDLVCLPVRLLERDEAVQARWQQRFRHLLVDEFQDTNSAQLALVKRLGEGLRNVCVVGDDDQSIYGWRGAEVRNILEFEDHFAGTRVVRLEENYRSRSPILKVANAAMAQAAGKRHLKTLRAVRGDGDRVRLVVLPDAQKEARFVAREITRLREEGRRYGHVAVLYRSNLQARLVEEELRAAAIPYLMVGGTQFYDRKEVKDAAAYLRVVVNPRDELSVRRIANTPTRGIGATSLDRMSQWALANDRPLSDAFGNAGEVVGLTEGARRGALGLHTALQRARGRFRSGEHWLSEAARMLFDEVGFQGFLTGTGSTGGDEDGAGAAADGAGARRWENVEFLLKGLERYEGQEAEDKPTLTTFLQRITMRFDQETGDEVGDRVTLSTLHASKGLEFDTVFLIGCVEGQLPHSRTTDPKVTEAAPTDVEEERRLFYVGVTRAKDRLYLTRPEKRMMRGRTTPLTPSRFLDKLPEEWTEAMDDPDTQALDFDELESMTADILARLGG